MILLILVDVIGHDKTGLLSWVLDYDKGVSAQTMDFFIVWFS